MNDNEAADYMARRFDETLALLRLQGDLWAAGVDAPDWHPTRETNDN